MFAGEGYLGEFAFWFFCVVGVVSCFAYVALVEVYGCGGFGYHFIVVPLVVAIFHSIFRPCDCMCSCLCGNMGMCRQIRIGKCLTGFGSWFSFPFLLLCLVFVYFFASVHTLHGLTSHPMR